MLVLIAMVATQAAGMISNSQSPQVVSVAVQPSPPVIMPPPPIVTTSRNARLPAVPGEIVPVRVRVTAGDRVLLNDVLRLTRYSGASYQESRTEAPHSVCSAPGYYGNGQRSSLNVSLNLQESVERGHAINVRVEWQRPSDSTDPCFGAGSRSISLAQTVALDLGTSQSLRGDGGLVVTVSRP